MVNSVSYRICWFISLLFCFSFLLFLFSDLSLAEDAKSIYEEGLDHGLTNNDTYSFFLMEKAGDSSEREKLLDQAKLFAPDLPAPYFKIASDRLDLSLKGLFESLDYIRKGIGAYQRNLLWRVDLLGLLTKGILFSFLLSSLLMIIIRSYSQAGLLMHEIKEDRKKTFLLLLPIIFSVFGFLPFVASLLSLYGLYIKKRDRMVIYLSFIIIILLSLSPQILRIFFIPSYLRAAIEVNEGRNNKYGLWRLKERTDLVSSFAYALALKREGHYQESIDIYSKLARGTILPEIYINLGNSLYASGNIDAAIESYNKSIAIRPLAAAYYNLSQVYRERLDFKRGEDYFDKAARLDPEGLRKYTLISGRNPNRFVVDVRLPDSLIWDQIVSESGGWVRVTLTSIVTVIAIISFFIIDRVLKDRAKRCRRCGSLYCNRCSRVFTWKDMCSGCYRSLVRMDQMYSKDRITNLLLVYETGARRRKLARLLSFLIPGAGQIYSGKVIEGFFLCWLFIFSLVVLILNRSIGGIYPFYHSWLVLPLIFVIILLYGLSIIHIRGGIRKGWL